MNMSVRRRCAVLAVGALVLALAWPAAATAQTGPTPPPQPQRSTIIYFFWGDGCPHCAAAKPVLEQLRQRYPGTEVRAYEVWNNTANQQLFGKIAWFYGFEPKAVPTIFIGAQHWVGYSDQTAPLLERAVAACAKNGCPDAGAGIVVPDPAQPVIGPVAPALEPTLPPTLIPTPVPVSILVVPLIGAINLETQSLALSTALIAFVDGVNPCSIWALTMLLAITLHTGSRRKIAVIGLVYISVTAFIYALFIAGLFTMFTVVSFVGWIQLAVAAVALFFGLVNVKDYFFYKQGLSLTIPEGRKPGLFKRMRGLVDASQSFGGLVGATVVLAAGVSLVEFSCTAGFPMLWTNLLVSQRVGPAVFLGLLLIYLVIYQLDELVIFFGAVVSLRASRLEEKHGRILKLAGGMLMLTLAIVMLVNPAAMNDIGNSIVIFGAAVAATLIVLLVHRRILPALGMRFGSEEKPLPPAGRRPERPAARHGH